MCSAFLNAVINIHVPKPFYASFSDVLFGMDYLKLTTCYVALEKTSKRLEKTAIIAEFLRTLEDEKDVKHIVYLLQGRVFPSWDERKIGVSDRLIVKALAMSFGFAPEKVEKAFVKIGDLGLVAEQLLQTKSQTTLGQRVLTTELVAQNLQKLATLEGEGTVARKVNLIAELLTSATPTEARFIVRTILEDLRIGMGEGTMRDAVVWAFFGKEAGLSYEGKGNEVTIEKKEAYANVLEKVQHAYDLTNDFAEVVGQIIKKGKKGLDELTLQSGKPMNSMLAVKVESPEEAIEVVGLPALCDYKLDGFRMQIHKNGDEVLLFTRRLENVTKQFEELVPYVRKYIDARNVILDAEVVGYDPKTGKYVPFQNISQRIKRKYDIAELAKKIPVEISVFDIILYNGKDMTKASQKERRALIEKIVHQVKGKLVLTEAMVAQSVGEMQKFYAKALKAGLEGIMVKDMRKEYVSGRKVGYWVKLKPVLENLDVVIVKAEYGTGKRAGVLSSYTIAVLSEDKEAFLELGKVSTGVKEKEAEGVSYIELTKLLKPLIKETRGKEVVVKPEVVIEVSYEEIQKSPSYSSGFALRFPRFVRLRVAERGPLDANTIEDVERIYKSQHTKKGKFHSKVQE